MAVWEYQIGVGKSLLGGQPKLEQRYEHLLQNLNNNGDQGWELTAILPVESEEGKEEWFIFKRPMPMKRKT